MKDTTKEVEQICQETERDGFMSGEGGDNITQNNEAKHQNLKWKGI
jgi:hypothetical protein